MSSEERAPTANEQGPCLSLHSVCLSLSWLHCLIPTSMCLSWNLVVLPNAQIYTIWNFRREALTPVFEAGGEAAQKASDGELALTHVGWG